MNEAKLRLGIDGKGEIPNEMKAIGRDGQTMTRIIIRGFTLAARQTAAFAGQLTVLTGALKLAGAPLVVLGAAVAGIVTALFAAIGAGQKASEVFAKIGDSAQNLDILSDTYQGLTAEANAQRVSVGALEAGLRTLASRSEQITHRQGELYQALKRTNPELLRQLEVLDTNEGRLRAVTNALSEAGSESDRARIASAAFGDSAKDLSRVLVATEGGVDGLIDKGRQLGLVIDADIVAGAQSLQTELQRLDDQISLQFNEAIVGAADLQTGIKNLKLEFAKFFNTVVQGFADIEDKSSRTNLLQLERLQDRLSRTGISEERFAEARAGGRPLTAEDASVPIRAARQSAIDQFNQIALEEAVRGARRAGEEYATEFASSTVKELEAESARIGQALSELQPAASGFPLFGQDLSFQKLELEIQRASINALIERRKARDAEIKAIDDEREAKKKALEQEREASKAERERQRLRREAAGMLAELGDATEALALKRAQLARIRELLPDDLISDEQQLQILKNLEDEITGVTEATRRWQATIDETLLPLDLLQSQVERLKEDYAAGKIEVELYSEALEVLTDRARVESDAYKDAEKVRERLNEYRKAAAGTAKRLADEEARLNDLIESGNLTRTEAAEYLQSYGRELRRTRGEISLLEGAESLLDQTLMGRIETIEDLGNAIEAMLIQVVRQATLAQAQSGTGGGFGDFLSGVFGRVGNSIGVGDALGGGSNNPSGTPPIIPQSHSGTGVGMPFRQMRMRTQPVMSNERLAVIRRDQEVLGPTHRKQIIEHIQEASDFRNMPSDLMRAGPLPLDIHLKISQSGSGQQADVEAQQTGDNTFDIDVKLRDSTRGAIASGEFDRALEGRGFVREGLR